MKTLVYFIAAITLFLSGAVYSFADEEYTQAPEPEGTSVIMIDASTGDVLYEKNADERRDPASVTKILTCLVVLENMKLDEKVTVMEDSSAIGVNIAMKKGEVLTVEQLLYALMLPSANDAARVLAIATAGDVDTFCDMMNRRAAECGATDTTFTNPNGLNLPGQENHKTTARDLSKITREAMKNDTFRKLIATRKYTIPATNKSAERELKGTNPLFASKKTVQVDGETIPLKYEGAEGVKTGTTSTAGNCFVGAAKRADTEFIVVTLNSGNLTRFTDAIRLMDYGYENYETDVVLHKGEEADVMKVRRGTTGKVGIGPDEILAITLSKTSSGKVIPQETKTDIKTDDRKLTAPVKAGDVVGTITLKDDKGETIRKVNAIALADVAKGGPLSYIGVPDDMVPLFIGIVATVILIALIGLYLVRSRNHKGKKKKQKKGKGNGHKAASGRTKTSAPGRAPGKTKTSAPGSKSGGRTGQDPRRPSARATVRPQPQPKPRPVVKDIPYPTDDTYQRIIDQRKASRPIVKEPQKTGPGAPIEEQSFDDFLKDLKVKMAKEEAGKNGQTKED